jgi:K+ transport systems, NAD-binding component
LKQYLIIGAGRFGSSLAFHLYKKGNEVMIIDESEDAITQVSDHTTTALIGNCRDERFINSVGVRNFDVIIIAFASDIASSILLATMLKEAGAKQIISKAKNEMQGKVLIKVGVNQVVYPERDMGKRIADNLSSSSVLEHIELSEEYGIMEFKAKPGWHGKSIGTINFRRNFGWNVIAVKENENINITPDAETIISKSSIIIAIGKIDSKDRLESD